MEDFKSKIMARTRNLLLIFICMLSAACEKSFLDQEIDGRLPVESIWSSTDRAFGFLNNAYTNLTGVYMRVGGAMLASASDEAKHSADESAIQDFNNGGWSAANPIENVWGHYYAGIRKTNLFLENIDRVPLLRRDNEEGVDPVKLAIRERMKGEAHFLRAFFYFELVKRYGGVPLVLKSLSLSDDLDIPRSSIDECIEQILQDCDAAVEKLPKVYGASGSTVEVDDIGQAGRATQGSALALKARALLYYASPLFNPQNTTSRWEEAAEAAKEVMDLNVYRLLPLTGTVSHNNIFYQATGAAQYHNEIIFSTNYFEDSQFDMLNAPLTVNGRGLTNPSQEMVDAFGMANGLAITDSRSGYDPEKPYVGRDPRFYAAIRYHGITVSQNDQVKYLSIASGSIDAVNSAFNATRTGYYLGKFSSNSSVWDLRTVTVNRTNVLMRYAEVLLNYAEARNEVSGPDQTVYDAVNAVRQRAGLNPSALPGGLSKEQMRTFIRNERRVELCFEEHRFFDVRRWKLYGNKETTIPVTGISVVIDEYYNPSFVNFAVENRTFTPNMYLMPIPQIEIAKSKQIIEQNPGW